MKIVASNNIPRETDSEILIKENIDERLGRALCKAHNDGLSDESHSELFWRLEEDNYQLYKWEP